MPEPFNSPKQAIAFLKRRGVHNKMLTREMGYYRTFVGLARTNKDAHEAAAIRYLKDHDCPCVIGGMVYCP